MKVGAGMPSRIKTFNKIICDTVELQLALTTKFASLKAVRTRGLSHAFSYAFDRLQNNPNRYGIVYTHSHSIRPFVPVTYASDFGSQIFSGKFKFTSGVAKPKIMADTTDPAYVFNPNQDLLRSSPLVRVSDPDAVWTQYQVPALFLKTNFDVESKINPITGLLDHRMALGGYISSSVLPRKHLQVFISDKTVVLCDPRARHNAFEFLRDTGLREELKPEGMYALELINEVFGTSKDVDPFDVTHANGFLKRLDD